MKFTAAVLASVITGVGAFTQQARMRSLSQQQQQHQVVTRSSASSCRQSSQCASGCNCPSCTTAKQCSCPACRSSSTQLSLSSTAVDEPAEPPLAVADADAVPTEVAAMDGINSPEEAHNAERPARKAIAKKKPAPPGKPLSEFSVGQTVTGKVRSIMTYGAFMDFGSESDGLLHISALSKEFVSDVKEVLQLGVEYEVRIVSIDLENKKVGLSKLTADEEQEQSKPGQRGNANARGGGSGRGGNNNNQVAAKLAAEDWDTAKFITGEVANTADFGAFVRFDAHDLVESLDVGSFVDGLVHISCLADGRVSSVTDVAKAGDKVQIRLKAVENKKVSLSMVSVEAEQAKADSRSGGFGDDEPAFAGNKDWKEALVELEDDMIAFTNIPLVKR